MEPRNITEELQEKLSNQTHYTANGIEPLDYITANSLSFVEGNIIKYVSRYKRKNGLEDLIKARVYLDRLIGDLQASEPREDAIETASEIWRAGACVVPTFCTHD